MYVITNESRQEICSKLDLLAAAGSFEKATAKDIQSVKDMITRDYSTGAAEVLDPLRTVQYVAQNSGYTIHAIRERIKSGALKANKPAKTGMKYLIKDSDFRKFLKEEFGE